MKISKSKVVDESIFRAYDIRGIYPKDINPEVVYKIVQAYCKFISPQKVVLGRDVRTSSPELFEAAKQGLLDHGVNVVDIGLVATDMMYFAVANYKYDGGLVITASHNPKEYNGIKLVRGQAIPVSGNTGIMEIKELVLSAYTYRSKIKGQVETKDITQSYLEKCLSFVDISKIKPYKIVANSMFGPAVANVEKMNLPIKLIPINESLDGNFPKGQPDPLQPQNQQETKDLILEEHADLGVAWDADADRCIIFDETGRFVYPYYVIAFLAEYFCRKYPAAKIIHDPRLVRAIDDKVRVLGGKTITVKAGRAFYSEPMQKNEAVFGGESSGHFFFKDFYYLDNGLIPFLLVLQILSESGKKASELFDQYFEKYPVSGERNYEISDPGQVNVIIENIASHFSDGQIDRLDGVSVEYPGWQANIRPAANEPLVRVNVEANSKEILKQKLEELEKLLK